jgi:addiction module RelE/StbE family toxin
LIQLRWTLAAADDLEEIANYLFEKAPAKAAELIHTIYEAPAGLKTFPYRGRSGKKQGTRKLLVPSLPYIIVYQVKEDAVNIVRILHAAQERLEG